MMKRILSGSYLGLLLVMLYAPILIIIVFFLY
jgi:ABC-type spermidine/putrescine transport system permease subunit II